jgi:hypothetical protein
LGLVRFLPIRFCWNIHCVTPITRQKIPPITKTFDDDILKKNAAVLQQAQPIRPFGTIHANLVDASSMGTLEQHFGALHRNACV